MNTETITLNLTPREVETIQHAIRLFADGADTPQSVVLDSGKVVRGKRPGYLADYTPDEFRIYFRKAVKSIKAKTEEAR